MCPHPHQAGDRSPALCQIQRAALSFIAPLKANVGGWRERYLEEVSTKALRPLGYISERERELPAKLRTRYRGAIRDWGLSDPETGEQYRFRIAYIHSSEEEREVKAARERALCRAEEKLGRISNGLGGRHYRTKKQVDRRVGQILAGQVKDLIEVKTATRKGRPTITWKRDEQAIASAARADGVYALATNSPTGGWARGRSSIATRASRSSSAETAISSKPCGCGRSSCTRTSASMPWSRSSGSRCWSSG